MLQSKIKTFIGKGIIELSILPVMGSANGGGHDAGKESIPWRFTFKKSSTKSKSVF